MLTNRNFYVKISFVDHKSIKFNSMRVCWNWQTGTFEGRVLSGVWVQVPSLAPKKKTSQSEVFFLCKNKRDLNPKEK